MTVMDTARVEAARKVFFEQRSLPVDQVNHAILRSWMRCADMGLDARRAPPAEAPSASDIRHLHERHEALRRISRPELDALYSEARDLSGIVILTNAKGEILDAVGDATFAGKAAEVALRPGVLWSEDGTGTNAIGTAIAERRSVAVNGAEHYFQAHGVLSCAATPIIDPRGAVLGVLDISTPASPQGSHMLGLMRLAAEQIEHRLFRDGFEDCRTLRFHSDASLLGAAREGILVLRDDVVVGANRRGLSLIGRNWDDLDQVRLSDLFDGAPNGTGRLRGHDGRDYFSRCDDNGRGTLVTANRLEDVETAAIRRALEAHGGNVSAAARALGIHRSTIYRKAGL
ncbi:sigma-54-dependent Fis family transcriptional regulator [Asticcacaulis sp. YBE204]|uniref:sigma-54-dependent Fis family transcriptional regulator n=1 Tax=Asticcacaulis sp. YBE204 TaxID=1282363 RepID=UPI0003C3D15D|nr:helix-turn-helix domain-containing protein [Asticcacaulis sp. YBE204]ESQ79930.1 Fis family transcriptional regulator [Asticcacaulis sp. YBE204]